MKDLTILDCTLRDGGYVNDWRFGLDTIKGVADEMPDSGIDIFEICFMRNEPYIPDRCIFPTPEQISLVLPRKNVKYAVMIETGCLLPIENMPERQDNYVDYVRFVTWKNKLELAYDYSRTLKERGYNVCIQPTRIDQYNVEEFCDMIKMFNDISPSAIYIVDTFGTLTRRRLLEYVYAADKVLGPDVAIGYHAHNNFQQAIGNAEAFIDCNIDHPKFIDASVMGIGRGSGNLAMELLFRYLNIEYGGKYDTDKVIQVAEKYIEPIFKASPWGYRVPYYISAEAGANPNYAKRCMELDIPDTKIKEFINSLQGMDRIRYIEDFINQNFIDEIAAFNASLQSRKTIQDFY